MGIYRIAGFIVRLNNQYPYTEWLCRHYAVESEYADFIVSASPEEIAADQALSGFSADLCESTALYRNLCGQLISHNTFLLHAAVVELHGSGYAFLGESGAGKSTHMALWVKHLGARIVNGDKPLIRMVKQEDDSIPQFIAYGTPWAGKEGLQRNTSTPLSAIVFIEQAERNEIVRLDPADCVKRIFHQMLLPKNAADASCLLALTDQFVRDIPAYRLSCGISREAAKLCCSTILGDISPNTPK